MTMKKGARSVRKGIFEHQKRTSEVYEQMAHAPEEFRASFLQSFRNPLVKRYAAKRIEEAVTDLALKRMADNELDPLPFIHDHGNCPVSGFRFPEQDSEHEVFAPREGYVANREAYGF